MMNKKLSLAIFAAFLVSALFFITPLRAQDNTVLYLNGEGTTIMDKSTKNHQITNNGNVIISTTQKKFGTAALYFNGSNYLWSPDSDDWTFKTSDDFTIDAWVWLDDVNASRGFLSQGENGSNFSSIGYSSSYKLYYTFWDQGDGPNAGGNHTQNSGYIPPVQQWFHWALVKSGSSIKCYVNGEAKISKTWTGSFDLSAGLYVGYAAYITNNDSGAAMKGYFDEFRIIKGKALWTSNFQNNLPAPLPTITFSTNKDLLDNGESATLTWSTLDASGCTLQYNSTTQLLDPNGTLTVTPNAPTTYTLVATGPGGTAYKEINVKVLNGYTATGPFTVATKVGIGVMNPQNALDVNGTIKAKEVQVTLNNWPDYVFNTDYELRNLKNLEAFIQQNRRLPDMPSAEELEKQGVSITEILKKQMQKIEELTLYIIQLQKQIEELKKE